MQEIWLRSNHRVIVAALVVSAAGLAIGLALWGLAAPDSRVLRGAGAVLAVVSAVVAICLLWRLRRPRIGRRGHELLFYLRHGAPLRVPLDLVEGFLLGQGPSYLSAGKPDAIQAATVVIRLADRATDYAKRDVRRWLGSWCNHYITIRGTWCEPLSVPLVMQLNQRLADAHSASATRSGDVRSAGAPLAQRSEEPRSK